MKKLKVCTGKMMMSGNTLTDREREGERRGERDHTSLALLW